jgi:HEAT repeat protein
MMNTNEDIKKYLSELEDDDIKVRDAARWHLVSIGLAAVPALIHQLKTDKERCRREAAQILGEIHDETAVDDLVEALVDDSTSVEWAASKALIKYDLGAIRPLREGLNRHFNSEHFRRCAFYILYTLNQTHQLGPNVQEMLVVCTAWNHPPAQRGQQNM